MTDRCQHSTTRCSIADTPYLRTPPSPPSLARTQAALHLSCVYIATLSLTRYYRRRPLIYWPRAAATAAPIHAAAARRALLLPRTPHASPSPPPRRRRSTHSPPPPPLPHALLAPRAPISAVVLRAAPALHRPNTVARLAGLHSASSSTSTRPPPKGQRHWNLGFQ